VAKVKQLGEEGRLSEEKVTALLEKLGKKSDEAKEGINSVSEALKTLGIRSDADLKKTADGFREAYEAVKKMGGSVREQQEAFKVYAKAAIEANGGVATSALKVEAAMVGLEINADKAGKSIVEAMGAGKDRVDDLAASLDNAAAAAERLGEGVEKVGEGKYVNAEGLMSDKSGAPIRRNLTSSWSDWSDEDLAYLLSDKRDADPMFDQMHKMRTPENMKAAREEVESRGAKRAVSGRQGEPTQTSTTHKISITLPNNKTQEFTMASGEDAAGLGVFLAQLGDARSRS